MIGNLNLHEIDHLLRTQQIGRLGLSDREGLCLSGCVWI